MHSYKIICTENKVMHHKFSASLTSTDCRHNKHKNFLVWVNEEDHCRVIAMEQGGNMKRTFERFCHGLKEVLTCTHEHRAQ